MEVVLIVFFAFLGAAIGSFLNVCIDRLPAGKSLSYPPSHCDACQRKLQPIDLMPVFSYLILCGHCRHCGASIPHRLILVELGTGLFFALTFWRYGLNAEFAIIVFYFCLFLVIGIIDLNHKLILNKIIYPALVVVLIFAASTYFSRGSLLFALATDIILPPGILSAVIGSAAGLVLLLIPAVVSRGGMGFGDVKMAMLIGLALGFPLVLVALLMGIILGGLVAIILLLAKIKKRKDAIPFGPFLSLTTIVALLWGPEILRWYLQLI